MGHGATVLGQDNSSKTAPAMHWCAHQCIKTIQRNVKRALQLRSYVRTHERLTVDILRTVVNS
jgi:hypothetical protein